MNVEIEVSVKVRVSDAPAQSPPSRPIIAVLLDRIASHPCVVMILREILRNS
jgi:hypothetical protein